MERTTLNRITAGATLAVAGLLGLAACGGGGGGTTAGSTSTVASTSFRTIPVTAPSTTLPPATAAPGAGGAAAGGAAAGAAAAGGAATGSGTYTVKSGDYFYGIAQKLGVKAEDLAAYNDMTVKSQLVPGMVLKVPPPSATTGTPSGGASSGGASSGGASSGSSSKPPTGATTTAASGPSKGTYTVKANDAWYLIASKLGVSADKLASFNGMTTSSPLYPGMKLKIPG